MSYEIYKSIRQNADGSFDVVSASSNTYTWDNKRDFRPFHMTYFNDKFPTATKNEKKALWWLHSTYSGDKFYPANWKLAKKLANQFMNEKGYDSKIFSDETQWLNAARELLEYIKAQKDSKDVKNYVVYFPGYGYVGKLTTRRAIPTSDINYAKVFKMDLEDLKQRFKNYEKYQPEFIEK